jgi:tetratricopeptide (TPR) repeat protein
LKNELPKHHANPFLYLSQNHFNDAIEILKNRLDSLNDQQIALEICKIVSIVKDGHTQVISLPFNLPPLIESRLFPLRVFHYPDGVYVTSSGSENSDLTGVRILKINDLKIEDVIKRVNEYVPGENEYYKMQWSFPYLLNAQLLKHLGVLEDESKAEFTFMSETGSVEKRTLKPILSPLYLKWYLSTRDLDDLSGKNRLSENYWYEYSDSSKILYIQINQVVDQKGSATLKEFSDELTMLIERNSIDKTIVDVRNCNGGDNSKIQSLLRLLSNPIINQRGQLFALVGRQTFSTGISLLAALERNTNIILVGEPAGSGRNQCGDVQTFVLPHSQLFLQVSSKFHQQGFYQDKSLTIEPSLKVNYTHQLKNTKDQGLELIYSYPKNQEAKVFSFDTATLDHFVGRFSYDVDKVLTITKSNCNLTYKIEDYQPFASGSLYAISSTAFYTSNSQLSFQFLNFENNQFNKLGIRWNNETDTLLRLPNSYQSPAEMIRQNRIDDALNTYLKAKSAGIHLAATTEAQLNALGYQYMSQGNFAIAEKIFNVNSLLFPFSGNAWDSLAEAWLKMGGLGKAELYYKKSLELNPDNKQARLALKQFRKDK